jgi:hypothetical protein
METQGLEKQPSESPKLDCGKLAEIPSVGFVTRRARTAGGRAWWETVTQHAPEPWPAARLALQARIAALDGS